MNDFATIHLRVPAALKARWVRQSRAAGQRLTDWIIARVERPVNTLPIPESIASQYHGAGHALAAITGGQIVRIVYLADALPDYDPGAPGALRATLDDARLGHIVRELQAVGQVSVGMCSCWEFVEL